MKFFKKFVKSGIQTKIFNLVAITMLLVIMVYTLVDVVQARQMSKLISETTARQKEDMDQVSTETMDSVAKEFLRRTSAMEANDTEAVFNSVKVQVWMLEESAIGLYEHPDEFPEVDVPDPSQTKNGVTCEKVMFAEGVDPADPEIEKEVKLLGNMAGMMRGLYESTNINGCLISSVNGITLIVDDRSSEKLKKDGTPNVLNAYERPWYIGAVEKGDIYFSEVEENMFNGRTEIACSTPIYHNGELVAVVEADIDLETLKKEIEASGANDSFAFVVNEKGHIIFSPQTRGQFKVEPYDKATDLRRSENTKLAAYVNKALLGKADVEEIPVDDKVYYMATTQMKSVGWAVISVADREAVMRPSVVLKEKYQNNINRAMAEFKRMSNRALIASILMIFLVLIIGMVNGQILAGRIVKPLNSMAEDVADVNGDNPVFTVKDIYRTNDEIEILADTLESLTERNKKYLSEILRISAEKERIGAELNVATKIQADMLPNIFPPFPKKKEFDLYASMDPAREVGGDFYDFFLVDDNHIALVMADVSGKGVPAALFMVIAKTIIKNRTILGGYPGEILEDVNNQLCEGNQSELFVTAWFAIIEISTGKGMASNAGHVHPALRRADGDYELVIYRHSPALTLWEGAEFEDREFQLNPGDSIFIYTDGVPEAMNKEEEMYGTDRMIEALNKSKDSNAKETIGAVARSMDEFVDGAEQFDDITMLCFKYYGQNDFHRKTDGVNEG